jgi:hypothetical protein
MVMGLAIGYLDPIIGLQSAVQWVWTGVGLAGCLTGALCLLVLRVD